MTHPRLADRPIYLDYNATTPIDSAVLYAAVPYLGMHFGNPSSGHHYAQAPRAAVERARAQIAELLDARPEEIVFTGGGSEADTLAVRGAALAAPAGRRHVITLPTASRRAAGVSKPAVRGLHDHPPTGRRARPSQPRRPAGRDHAETALVSIAYGNSETGTLQPIAELAAIAHAHGAVFHTAPPPSAAETSTCMNPTGSAR